MLCELPDDDTISMVSSVMMPQIELKEGKSFLYPRLQPRRIYTPSPYPRVDLDLCGDDISVPTKIDVYHFYPANSTSSYVIPQYLKQSVGASKLFEDEYFIGE